MSTSNKLLEPKHSVQLRQHLDRALRVLWGLVVLAGALALLTRAGFNAMYGDWMSVIVGVVFFCILIFVLLMLEGLQVAGLKTKHLEMLTIQRVVANASPKAQARVLYIHERFAANFNRFVVGRQLMVIASVVAITLIVNQIQVPPDALNTVELGPTIASILNSSIATFLISTGLPFWTAQILSQFIADKRPVAFAAIPGARALVRGTLLLHAVGVGHPSLYASTVITSRMGTKIRDIDIDSN